MNAISNDALPESTFKCVSVSVFTFVDTVSGASIVAFVCFILFYLDVSMILLLVTGQGEPCVGRLI